MRFGFNLESFRVYTVLPDCRCVKLTSFALRLALTGYVDIPRENDLDYLAEVEAMFVPLEPANKKPGPTNQPSSRAAPRQARRPHRKRWRHQRRTSQPWPPPLRSGGDTRPLAPCYLRRRQVAFGMFMPAFNADVQRPTPKAEASGTPPFPGRDHTLRITPVCLNTLAK